MATARQISANRRNAAGPHKMTEAGKQAVRGNAIRHGLAARAHVLLPNEDQNFFNEILESLRAEHAPSGTQQELLVHQIAESYWRLQRARNMENASLMAVDEDFARVYDLEPAPANDLARNAQLGMAFSKNSKMFDKLNRYAASAERSYYRAIHELAKLQKQIKPEPETRSATQEAHPAHAPAQIRSVPQKPPACTQRDMEIAAARMSADEFNELLNEITAPPPLKPSNPDPQN
jgi:hypothetical protein